MRVFGTQSTSTSSVRKTKRGTSASGESFSVDTPEEAPANPAARGVAATSSVDALLALQTIEDEDPERIASKKPRQ